MKSSKKYYKALDLIRVIACISVLLYHLNILKGGYLAVCVFFVLSGYLSCISAFKKEKFSFKSYYYNRFIHLYIPLLAVVFISICIISFIPAVNWLNLKPETTSILLGYNNFWQLSANLDYFARHVNSPFMHLWYIAILLQFDLVFPFLFAGLKKIGDRFNKLVSCLLPLFLVLVSCIYFYIVSLNGNIMIAYYNTFTRVFSLLFGVSLGFVHSYYKPLVPESLKKKQISKFIFYVYLLILICISIFIDAKSILFQVSMIFATLISCRLIDYGTIGVKVELNKFDNFIKFISAISYEVYLVQYPIIFLLQYISINIWIKLFIIIILTFVLAFILHFSLSFKNKKNKFKLLRYILSTIFLIISLYGFYQYVIAEDHTAEMKALENQLNQNEKLMQERQEEYALKLKQEEEAWMSRIESLELSEDELKSMVSNLPVVGLGDSVMLGALQNLYDQFPNGYFDAKISRTAYVANGILQSLDYNNMLGDPIIFNFGANGDCPDSYKIEIMNTCGNRKVFWVNVTNDNDVHVNDRLNEFASKYPNLYIIDWNSISSGHQEYFFADGIHLTDSGRAAYTNAIYESIYQVYLSEYKEKKQKLIFEYEESQKNKISFYGNDILLNLFEYIQEDFKEAKFNINKEFDYEKLKQQVIEDITNNTLNNKIVFVFDNSVKFTLKEYQELINLCSGHEIYILSSDNIISTLQSENVKVVNLYKEINSHNEYLMIDKIHLTEKGNLALKDILNDIIK